MGLSLGYFPERTRPTNERRACLLLALCLCSYWDMKSYMVTLVEELMISSSVVNKFLPFSELLVRALRGA